jgi:hypothetical protein
LDPVPSFEPSREGFLLLKYEGINAFLDKTKESIEFVIKADIVEKLIGELFFHPKENEKDEDLVPATKPNEMNSLSNKTTELTWFLS